MSAATAPPPLLVGRLAARAAAQGSAIAVVAPDGEASYAALWARACDVARRLRAAGFGRGTAVALAFDNSVAGVAALYGCWAAGLVAVQLNTAAREADHANWLAHSGARLLLAGEAGPAAAAAAACGLPVWLETTAGEVMAAAAPLPDGPLAGDVASVIYTSGTSGRPKGVALTHGNFAANVDSIIAYLGLTAADSTVTVLPFFYSYGGSVLHTHLAVGGRVVVEPSLVYPHVVVERMAREAVTGFAGVPSTFALLLARVDPERLGALRLRYLTQAGGGMPVELQARVRSAFAPARLFVMYGQTEATARLTYLPPEWLEAKAGAVGLPIPGVELQVRGESGAGLPAGTVGEVWARGANVMAGYWRDPEATATTLVDGWLRTGDEGHLDADGVLYLAGRRSDIIKTGAHRVFPQDIEEVITSLDGVSECAAVGAPDPMLGEVVQVFVVPEAGREVQAQAIRAACRARLAAYKVPKYIESVAALPRTASGKVRRGELRERAAMNGSEK